MACSLCRRSVPAHRPAALRKTLTPITTVSSPWNLGIYRSPLVTSELLRGLKRHITLMVHSAGSAIFHGLRMEIHRPNEKYSEPWIPGTAVRGQKRGRAPGFRSQIPERVTSSIRLRRNNLCFPPSHFPCCYEAMIPVDQRLATSPVLLLWMCFTMTSSRRHSLCCCNGALNYPRTATQKVEESRNCTIQTLIVCTTEQRECKETYMLYPPISTVYTTCTCCILITLLLFIVLQGW